MPRRGLPSAPLGATSAPSPTARRCRFCSFKTRLKLLWGLPPRTGPAARRNLACYPPAVVAGGPRAARKSERSMRRLFRLSPTSPKWHPVDNQIFPRCHKDLQQAGTKIEVGTAVPAFGKRLFTNLPRDGGHPSVSPAQRSLGKRPF